MKYPITPEYLENAPKPLVKAILAMEDDLLREICSRFKLTGELNEVTINDIRTLKTYGLDMDTIERRIANHTKTSTEEVQDALDRVVKLNREYYGELSDKAGITMPLEIVTAREIELIRKQMLDEYRNITRSLGFAVQTNGEIVFRPIAKAYQAVLDKAEMKVYSGGFTVQQALEDAVRELADSGIRTVDYASGWMNHADVAARRAIVTGLNQVTSKYAEEAAEVLETDLYEVTAHRGARDKDKPHVWSNHKRWQGKVYATKDGSKYPNIYKVCGLGQVDGLEGANCRHHRYPFLEGVSERVYTDDELKNIDPPPFEYQGKTYTAYEATQMQRKLETAMRKQTRRRMAFEAAGDTEQANNAKIRLQALRREYKAFSEAAELPTQFERAKVTA
jgi:hypothetical protein